MITAITIENFKGIRERVRLAIKPITLLFGPNSGGKSTILQAILYASEILERRNLDADATQMGGGLVDLGGYRNFVHNHNCSRPMSLRFDFTLDEGGITHRSDFARVVTTSCPSRAMAREPTSGPPPWSSI